MTRRAVLLLAGAAMLAGCGPKARDRVATLPAPGQTYSADGKMVRITGLKALPPPGGSAVEAIPVPPQFQYLYGSAEAAALSRQAYRALVNYASYRRAAGESVVLKPGATLAAPQWEACDGKQRAAVFDADETVVLNLGVEALAARNPAAPFDAAQWSRWEQTGAAAVASVPGAVEAFAALRAANIAVIINSNRSAANMAGTIAGLKAAGLGDFTLGVDLFLNNQKSSGKDSRRTAIAQRYCVVAMAGDQLGDFSDLFNAISSPAERRRIADSGIAATMWGNGWFVLPNPVYGPALKGGFDDVFPADKRWSDAR